MSFIDTGREGLFPHELRRETVIADVRWRNPDWYKELHNRARKFYLARLPNVSLSEQQRILYDLFFCIVTIQLCGRCLIFIRMSSCCPD